HDPADGGAVRSARLLASRALVPQLVRESDERAIRSPPPRRDDLGSDRPSLDRRIARAPCARHPLVAPCALLHRLPTSGAWHFDLADGCLAAVGRCASGGRARALDRSPHRAPRVKDISRPPDPVSRACYNRLMADFPEKNLKDWLALAEKEL